METKITNIKQIKVGELVDKYLQYIDVKENTTRTYYVGLKQFRLYLEKNNIFKPAREDIINFRNMLLQEHKPNTVNSYLIAVRNFYNWLEYENITKDISKKIKGVKVNNEHKRNSLTQEQCKLVLDNAKNIREKLIFLLGATCGLRANEIINIQLEDFKVKENKVCLYVLGKARDYKEDFVIISEEVYNILLKYIKEYNITNYLFTSLKGNNPNNKLTTKTIRFIIKDMFKRVGIVGEEYSCHSLRHSFATMSIQSGLDIREVSQAMRHKSISTTTIYLHDMQKINNKCTNNVSNMLLKEEI